MVKKVKVKKEMCQNCGEREATVNWLGHGSSMDFIHGNYQRWCEVCALKAQIEYQTQELKELPERIESEKKRLEQILRDERENKP